MPVACEVHEFQIRATPLHGRRGVERNHRSPAARTYVFVVAGLAPAKLNQVQRAVTGQIQELLAGLGRNGGRLFADHFRGGELCLDWTAVVSSNRAQVSLIEPRT